MKKIIVGLVILMPIALGAALSNGGGMGNWKSKQDSNGDVVIKTLAVDGNGTPIPTPTGGGGAAVVVTNTTPIPVTQATPTPGIQGVSLTSNTSSYLPSTITVLSGVSYTAIPLNTSSVAGTQSPQMVSFSSPGGAAGFKILWTTTSSVPTYLVNALAGDYVAASTTSQYFGAWYPGTIAWVYTIGGPAQIVAQQSTAK